MTPTTLQAIFAPAMWLGAALLCLLFEAAGTPVGARKRGARTHLAWIIGLTGGVIVVHALTSWAAAATPASSATGLIHDRGGLLASAGIALLVIAAHTAAVPGLRGMGEERGEMSAAFAAVGAGFSLVVISANLLSFAAGLVLVVAAVSLVAAPDRDGPHGIEAATKAVVGAGLTFALLSLALVFVFTAAGDASPAGLGRALQTDASLALPAVVLVVVVFALMLGTVPLHQKFVDVAHGASAASSGLLAGGALLAGGCAALRFVDGIALAGPRPELAQGFAVLAALTLIGAPIASLDQTRIARVVAYVVVVPGGLVLAAAAAQTADPSGAVAAWRAGTAAALTGALGASAALLGILVPQLDPSSTWEDWAGFGRRRPVMAALLVYAVATAAGVPGTAGFVARLEVARACVDAHLDALALIAVASAAIGAAPLVRLALFLFAKHQPPAKKKEPPRIRRPLLMVSFTLLVVLAAVIAIAPWLLDGVLEAARR